MCDASESTEISYTRSGQISTKHGIPITVPLLSSNSGLPRYSNQLRPALYLQGADSLANASAFNPSTTAANATATVGPITCTFTRNGNEIQATIPASSLTTANTNTLIQFVTASALAGASSPCYILPADFRPAATVYVPVLSTVGGTNLAGAALKITSTGLVAFVTAVPGAALGAAYTAAANVQPAASSEVSIGWISNA